MGHYYLIAALLLWAVPAWAALPGGCDGVVLKLDGVREGCAAIVDLDGDVFTPSCSGGSCTLSLSSQVTQLGQEIGNSSTEFADPTLFDGRTVDMGAATSLEIPVQTGTQPTADGILRLNDDLDRVEVGSDGNRTLRIPPALAPRAVGGVEATNTFTYAGEVTSPTDCSSLDSSCARTVCRCGICTGSNGSGTCTLTNNSMLTRGGELVAPIKPATVLNVKSFTHTAGTITVNASDNGITAGGHGLSNRRALIIRVRDDATFTSGTLSMKGVAGPATAGGTVLSTTAGRSGGNLTGLYTGGSAGGNTSGTGGGAGTDVDVEALSVNAHPGFWLSFGSGGGSAPVTGNANAGAVDVQGNTMGMLLTGATGGGGGGCAGSASGTAGAGGKGGGALRIEVGGKATFSSGYTIDAMGADGGRNGGGGGGGGVHILAGEISGSPSVDTGTCSASTPRCCVGGGAGGASGGNCGAGGNGGDGACIVETVPR